jgi:hypothetical protein
LTFGATAVVKQQHASATIQEPSLEGPRRPALPVPGFSTLRRVFGPVGRSEGGGRKRPIGVLLVVGVILVALLLRFPLSGRSKDDAREPSANEICRQSLARGEAVILSPEGDVADVPRSVACLVPPTTTMLTLLVVNADGTLLLSRSLKPDDEGVFVDPVHVTAEGGTFKALRVVAPFPETEGVLFTAGGRYGVAVALPGGHVSRSEVFRLGP